MQVHAHALNGSWECYHVVRIGLGAIWGDHRRRRSLHFTTPHLCLKKGWVYPLVHFPSKFPCPRSRLRIWSRATCSAVPSRLSPLIILQAESGAGRIWCPHTVDHHHWRMSSRLTRDGAAEPISRGRILRRERKGIGRKTFFLFS